MATAEKQAQKARADHLRDLIQEIVSGEAQPTKSTPESPRDFVNRKIREAEAAEREKKQSESEESCTHDDPSD